MPPAATPKATNAAIRPPGPLFPAPGIRSRDPRNSVGATIATKINPRAMGMTGALSVITLSALDKLASRTVTPIETKSGATRRTFNETIAMRADSMAGSHRVWAETRLVVQSDRLYHLKLREASIVTVTNSPFGIRWKQFATGVC